jgi:hypothetical protein
MSKISVLNRSGSTAIYTIPEDNITRIFAPGETKNIEENELEKLTYQPGGKEIIEQCFLIQNEELVEEFLGEQEPEYWLTPEGVKDLLLKESADRLHDCLTFGPQGVQDLVKDYAVSLPVTDIAKLDIIKEVTGFDAASAIKNNRAALEDNDSVVKKTSQQRRVALDTNKTERVATPRYNVVRRS